MSWVATAIIATTVVTSAIQYKGAKKAERSAKKQAKEAERIENRLTEERVREVDVTERVQYGRTVAGYAGGGVQAGAPGMDKKQLNTGVAGSSPNQIIQEAAREFARERELTKEVGASNALQIKMKGKATADMYRYQGYATLAQGIGTIFSVGAQKSAGTGLFG
jgi:hypothetical protein